MQQRSITKRNLQQNLLWNRNKSESENEIQYNKTAWALGKKDTYVYQCPSDGVYFYIVNTIAENISYLILTASKGVRLILCARLCCLIRKIELLIVDHQVFL